MIDVGNVARQLKRDEGAKIIGGRHVVYKDSVGIDTVGYGRNLERGLSDDEAEYLLINDIREAIEICVALYPNFVGLPQEIKEVLVNMAFNLGRTRLAKFVSMREAVLDHDFDAMANEMVNSAWFTQVKSRATRLVERVRTVARARRP